MSDEARQCPVTPQELRLFAKHVLGGNYWPPRILELADWLEKPAPAFSSRCPHCDHAVHVGTCLQALRVGKPGEDQFCLCEPTRAAEGQECTCGVVIQEGPFVYAPEVPDGAVLKIEYCELHQPASPAQARPACRFTECRKSGGCENSDRWCERPADPGDKYDPRHGLAQARPVTREQVMNVIIGAPVWRRFGPGDAADRLTDEIMKLLEGAE